MFSNIEEAIAFEKDGADGAIPLFEYRAYEERLPNGEIEYENRVWVKILNRGDSKNIQEGWLNDRWKERFKAQLQAFYEQTDLPTDGTALDVCPAFTKADIANCNKKHIRTVEQLAALPDTELPSLRNGRVLKNAAEKFLQFR